jgi:AcrR family transcriptional regulator
VSGPSDSRSSASRSSASSEPGRRPQGRRDAAPGGDLREAILTATAGLLAERSFSDLAVSDILTAAGISRGSFYFYFDSKHAVLAELVRRAVAQGHEAAAPWLARPADPATALRAGITAGARLWQVNAPVLRAIVESWRTDPRLTQLWLEQMQSFTDATVAQLSADPGPRRDLGGQSVPALAAALTWLGERLYYLAAIGIAPFDDQDTLISTLLHVWTTALYQT